MEAKDLLIPVILAILTGLVFPIIREWLKSLREGRLKRIVELAVGIAEQTAANYAKEHKTLTSKDKKATAMTAVYQLASKAGIKVDEKEVGNLIEAILGDKLITNNKKKG